jgi:hypothetical protein
MKANRERRKEGRKEGSVRDGKIALQQNRISTASPLPATTAFAVKENETEKKLKSDGGTGQ